METDILYWIQENWRSDFLDETLAVFTGIGDKGALWIGLAVFLIFFKKTRPVGLAMGLALLLCLFTVNLTMKPIFMRMRPYEAVGFLDLYIQKPLDFSFPSGHTASSFAAAWAFFRMSKHPLRYFLILLAGIIAFSRLYFFVHYPSDIGVSLLIGVFLADVSVFLIHTFYEKKKIRSLNEAKKQVEP